MIDPAWQAWRDRNPEAADALCRGEACVVPLTISNTLLSGCTYRSPYRHEVLPLAAVRLDKPTAPAATTEGTDQ